MITKRAPQFDITWNRAWTATILADLSDILARHGDIAYVVSEDRYYSWRDNNTWFPDGSGGSSVDWTDVLNKPSIFPPIIGPNSVDAVAGNDARLSNARVPLNHNTTHVTGGSDIISNVAAGGNSGLMIGSDKTKLDGIATGAEVNVNADWNAGSGDAQILNKPSIPSQYTDEMAQDAIGLMADSQSLLYTDVIPLLEVKIQQSLIKDASGLKLSGDSASPGNSQLYGTNGSGVKGWYTQPGGGGASPILANGNTVNEIANAVDTYLVASKLDIGGRIKAGSKLRWKLSFTKTAAGIATPIWGLRFGINGTIADTIRNTFTGPIQTAVVDTGWVEIEAIIRAVTVSGTVQGVLTQEHINTTTGIQNTAQVRIFQSLSATFDLTSASLKVGISINPGTAGVWTFQLISAEALNLV